MKKTVVLGSTNTDMVITGNKLPTVDETVSGSAFNGAFVAALGEGRTPTDAITFSHNSVPFRKEIV